MSELQKARVLSKDCPSRAVFGHLTSRWGALVMVVLLSGTKRFSQIRREIEGISERMLSETLKQLEQDGMLIRHDYQTVPPHTEYTLTEHGRQAGEMIDALVDWLESNLTEILAKNTKTTQTSPMNPKTYL